MVCLNQNMALALFSWLSEVIRLTNWNQGCWYSATDKVTGQLAPYWINQFRSHLGLMISSPWLYGTNQTVLVLANHHLSSPPRINYQPNEFLEPFLVVIQEKISRLRTNRSIDLRAFHHLFNTTKSQLAWPSTYPPISIDWNDNWFFIVLRPSFFFETLKFFTFSNIFWEGIFLNHASRDE